MTFLNRSTLLHSADCEVLGVVGRGAVDYDCFKAKRSRTGVRSDAKCGHHLPAQLFVPLCDVLHSGNTIASMDLRGAQHSLRALSGPHPLRTLKLVRCRFFPPRNTINTTVLIWLAHPVHLPRRQGRAQVSSRRADLQYIEAPSREVTTT